MKKTEKGELNIKLKFKSFETEEGSKKEKTKLEIQWKSKSVEKPKYPSKKQKKKKKDDEIDDTTTTAELNPEGSGKDLQHELDEINRKIQALLDKKVFILMKIKDAQTVAASAPMTASLQEV